LGINGWDLWIEPGLGGAAADRSGEFRVRTARVGSGLTYVTQLQIDAIVPPIDNSNILIDIPSIGQRRVEVGAANSGGVGFRTMRVLN
jgi:hypothetical protein